MQKEWYNKEKEEIAKELETSLEDGLSKEQVKKSYESR